jgi:hypothetical protein
MIEDTSVIIEIKRVTKLQHQNKEAANKFALQGKVSIGSYFETGTSKTATGLSRSEINLLLPLLIDFDVQDRDFKKEVTKYFDSMFTQIPSTGRELETGLMDNSLTLGAKLKEGGVNLPLEVEDYVAYRHCLGFPFLAKSLKEAKGDPRKTLYILDRKKESLESTSKRELQDTSFAKYLAIKDDSKMVSQVLSALGVSTRDLITGKALDEVSLLKDASMKRPKAFIQAADNKDLKLIYTINSMVNLKIVIKEGTRYIFEGSQLAVSMKDFIEYMRDSKNSKTVAVLKARLEELS